MNQIFKYSNSKRLLLLTLWCVIIGLFIVVSHIESIPFKDAVESVQAPSYGPTFEIATYFERKAYEQLLSSYQFRVMRTIIIAGIGLYGFFHILRERKITITTKSFSVYSMFGKKPLVFFEWNNIRTIHIGYAKGIRGISGDEGIYIEQLNEYDRLETTFVSLKYIEQSVLLIDQIKSLVTESVEITTDDELMFQSSESNIRNLLSKGFKVYKMHYKILFVFSAIIFTFAFLQRYYTNSPVNMLASIANIYFGYRGMIALNYYLFKHYKGANSTFDESWLYGESQIGRFIGAGIIKSTGLLFTIVGTALVIATTLHPSIKILTALIIIIIGVVFYSRMYLISSIASVIDVKSSYMVMNTSLWHKHLKEIIGLSIISLLPLVVMSGYIGLTYVDLESTISDIERLTYLFFGINFFFIPFKACFDMYLLEGLQEKNVEIKVEDLDDEKLI